MVSVSVGEAKNTLPQLLHLVEDGQEVQVTRHGKVVAYINGQSVSTDRGARFLESLRAWREKYGGLLQNQEVDAIFSPSRSVEPEVRHGEDFL